MSTLVNSEDPDEMQHNAAFHQGLHCLQRLKKSSGIELYLNQYKPSFFLWDKGQNAASDHGLHCLLIELEFE